MIQSWHDREISGGREWKDKIDKNLEAAQIILLLIGANFLASDYCYDIEMTRALEKHKLHQVRVVPIIIRPVDWQGAPFSELQALPENAEPVTTWSNVDAAWTDVAKGIRRVVEEIQDELKSVTDLSDPISETDTVAKVTYVAKEPEGKKPVDIFIGDAGFDEQSRIATVGCLVLESADLINQGVEKIREDLLSDPFIRGIPGTESALKKNGFRYLTDDPEVHTRFIEALREFMFMAYICFADREILKSDKTTDDSIYYRLYGRLIYERLRANKSRSINIWLAKKLNHRLGAIQQITTAQVAEIARRDRVGVLSTPMVCMAGVNELCFAVADYTICVVQQRLADPNSILARDFEKIRSKVRVIHNFETGEFYTRENPLP